MELLDKIKNLFKKKPPVRNKDTGTALERYRKSFFHAIDGMVYITKYEHNVIIIIIATILVTILGFILKIKAYEWLFVILVCGSITACEAINSAIEAAIDLTTTEIHPLAKISKDTASSATLILCITALIGGIVIFLPKIIELI